METISNPNEALHLSIPLAGQGPVDGYRVGSKLILVTDMDRWGDTWNAIPPDERRADQFVQIGEHGILSFPVAEGVFLVQDYPAIRTEIEQMEDDSAFA
jgi:hypothetical protein